MTNDRWLAGIALVGVLVLAGIGVLEGAAVLTFVAGLLLRAPQDSNRVIP